MTYLFVVVATMAVTMPLAAKLEFIKDNLILLEAIAVALTFATALVTWPSFGSACATVFGQFFSWLANLFQ